MIFLLPNFKIGPVASFLSIKNKISLSKKLVVDGGPKILIISFLFVLFIKSLSCFRVRLFTPWWSIAGWLLQFANNKKKVNNNIFMNNYLNIYNNLVKLTRNKELYKGFKIQDTFSDRLIFFLLHFAFFLKVYKEHNNKKVLQEIYDFIFRQVELSIREIGYGDQSINKKMKDYLNLFYGMIDKIHTWDELDTESRSSILVNFLDKSSNIEYLVKYFENYRLNLTNNTLNSYIKGVVKH